ncbi:VOC family protein [Alkalicoccobacillus murimartini]|uniref:Catechol 2,3-dioxygenase-like lactoylglutathione lyase family enzyme n=1 Tax=Alkalicoccobacillus murimartini TaxID=171685 RepID=A0ABT9YL46_9BACI|nr:VOC family protein [Alkalicoccobacillus murimartini]MDQ0207927.1 catechol 2,3-dioxygenase-like lactoylglutathione lyase family enzyme [Alkalicoccobacillus murimartini]
MTTFLSSIHHVQLAAPKGSEDQARTFYTEILGFTEVEKPAQMKVNGGCWFEQGTISLHIGIETPFVPAEKAHPAFYTEDLDGLVEHLKQHNITVEFDTRYEGFKRFYVYDPFNNRIEILQRQEA